MDNSSPSEEFASDLTRHQRDLYAFILSLFPDPNASEDILQDTNVVIWRNYEKYTPGTNFFAWACQIAKNQVLTYVRSRQRDRRVFSETLVEQVAARSEPDACPLDDVSIAMNECLDQCDQAQRQLLTERYLPGASVKEMAQARGISANKLSTMLCRLRRVLLTCIRRKIAKGERP